MAYVNAAAYREREAQWREEASTRTRRGEQATCVALAEGYADLARLTEALGSADSASARGSVTARILSQQPDRSALTRQEKPQSALLG
jgi:hypothetical protein